MKDDAIFRPIALSCLYIKFFSCEVEVKGIWAVLSEHKARDNVVTAEFL